jgi:hypothetical protein
MIMTVSHRGGSFCVSDKPSFWKLIDGFDVAWNLNQERINKARELLYDPARKFEFAPAQ